MDRKDKKKRVLARNKKNQMIFQHARIHKAEHERAVEDEEALAQGKKAGRSEAARDEAEQIWTEKVQDVRNKLTGKKRQAHERWNRYAGTSDAGSRGR